MSTQDSILTEGKHSLLTDLKHPYDWTFGLSLIHKEVLLESKINSNLHQTS